MTSIFEEAMQLSRETGMDLGDAALQVSPVKTMKFESRLEAAARERREYALMREAEITEADAKGLLWTVQAALYPGRVFCVIYQGRVEDTEPLTSQHRASGVFLGPVFQIGDQRKAMAEALALFTVDEVTIRVVKSA